MEFKEYKIIGNQNKGNKEIDSIFHMITYSDTLTFNTLYEIDEVSKNRLFGEGNVKKVLVTSDKLCITEYNGLICITSKKALIYFDTIIVLNDGKIFCITDKYTLEFSK